MINRCPRLKLLLGRNLPIFPRRSWIRWQTGSKCWPWMVLKRGQRMEKKKTILPAIHRRAAVLLGLTAQLRFDVDRDISWTTSHPTGGIAWLMNINIPLGSTSLSIRTVLKAFQFGVEVVKGWNVVFTMIPQGWRWDLRYLTRFRQEIRRAFPYHGQYTSS